MYDTKVGPLLQLTCLSIELDSYLQPKSIVSNSSVSKAMHEMVLNELCLMHDHAFFKLSFIKLPVDPLNWCTLFSYANGTMPVGISLLKISLRLPLVTSHYYSKACY